MPLPITAIFAIELCHYILNLLFSEIGEALKETVRAEPVEACSRKLRDAQSAAAASVFVRLCPSTGSGRTVL